MVFIVFILYLLYCAVSFVLLVCLFVSIVLYNWFCVALVVCGLRDWLVLIVVDDSILLGLCIMFGVIVLCLAFLFVFVLLCFVILICLLFNGLLLMRLL